MQEDRIMARHIDALKPAHIETIVEEATCLLVEAAHPEKIILFGSYARGEFDVDSNSDLLIILPTVVDPFEEMVRLRLVLRDIPMAIGVSVSSRSET